MEHLLLITGNTAVNQTDKHPALLEVTLHGDAGIGQKNDDR